LIYQSPPLPLKLDHYLKDSAALEISAALSIWVKRCLAEKYIIESAWEARWLLEYVKSAGTLERQPRA